MRCRLSSRQGRLPGCLLLLVLIVAACGGSEAGSSESDTPVPATPSSEPSVVATAPPAPDDTNPFVGTSQLSDATDDVDGPDNAPPGVELTGVRVIGSAGQLVMTWYTTETAEIRIDEGATAAWVIELANGDAPAYDITFQVAGKEWDILVLDRATGEETKHRIGSIYRDRLEVPYPAEKLTGLEPTFTWTARSNYADASGATWTDTVPDDGGRVAFPD